ncbi:MAG TPA: discoidin domain-containing protein [Candidatus Methylacidiphilales bacterium]|nr:discoidin domain-containing protein [Candidatus Methylacidiphilales bacterium]
MNLFKYRLALLALLAVFPLGGIGADTNSDRPAISQWVYPGRDGKLVYKTTARGDHIMDFSTAGYMGGGVALPTVPVAKTVKPSGKGDDTATIQTAINAVAAMPLKNGFRGAVLLAPGTFICSTTIYLPASGVVLRGSGSSPNGSTIMMAGGKHVAISTKMGGRRPDSPAPGPDAIQTFIADSYVPGGSAGFTVANAKGFAVGDVIEIRRPVTAAWVKFMGMDTLTRGGKPQTWIKAGTFLPIERRIAAISGNKITLDVPLSASIDAKYLNPPGTAVVKISPPNRLTQVGIEEIHIQSPPQRVNHTEELYSAIQLNGEDCWMRNLMIDETMNSVGIGGRRITLENVTINRKALHLGASKPAEFAPNGDQILLNRCSVNADNVWFAATGAGHSGPIVFLNCAFGGDGHIEGHQRWTTGMLLDNCSLPDGGIDFKDRGAMGSGHGWGMAWAVAWNCVAQVYTVQKPPGAMNWAIGCIGQSVQMSQPFDAAPLLPEGAFDSRGKPVAPRSLYLAQLAERLGPKALQNIGYSSPGIIPAWPKVQPSRVAGAKMDEGIGTDFALNQPVTANSVRGGKGNAQFTAERAVDGDSETYWAPADGAIPATLEVDLKGPTEINSLTIEEAADMTGRVQQYKAEGQVGGNWKLLSQGTAIGERKIDHFPSVTVWKVRFTILKAKDYPAISEFGIYLNTGSK